MKVGADFWVWVLSLAGLLFLLFGQDRKKKVPKPPRENSSETIPLDLESLRREGLTLERNSLFAYGREGRIDRVRDQKGKIWALKTYRCARDSQDNELFILAVLGSGRNSDRKIRGVVRLKKVVGPTSVLLSFVDGPSLKSFVSKVGANDPRVPKLVEKAAEIIQNLHRNGIAHGDALAKNFIVTKKKGSHSLSLTVCDFTHSRIFSHLSEADRHSAINFDLEKIQDMRDGIFT